MRQEGKTNLLCYHLSLTRCPFTLWDEIGAVSRILKPLNPKTQRIINPNFYTTDKTKKRSMFHQICQRVMLEGNQLFIVDEVHQYCTKRTLDPELEKVVTLGGNKNIGFIGTTQTVRQVHNTILGNTRHFWIMRTFLKPDVNWISFFIPKETVLMSKDLPPHGYIYYPLGGKALLGSAVKKMSLT